MNTEKHKSISHSVPHQAATTAVTSFQPINAIHRYICAFHVYAHDRSRHVVAHHFCKHVSPALHQCVIYDSDEANAKLIGIEYIVSEKVFESFSKDEKRYWHAHDYEIKSGLLQIKIEDTVAGAVNDLAEKPIMLEFYSTYGKTIHTWAIDIHPDLPLGPPNLMMSYTADDQVDPKFLKARDERYGMSTEGKRELRKGYLPAYKKLEGSDGWESSGKGVVFEPVEHDIKYV